MEQRFMLVGDHECSPYIIPIERYDEWELMYSEWKIDSPPAPVWAVKQTGLLTFTNFQIGS